MDDSAYGFVHCGTIYVEEDSYPRLAYEKVGSTLNQKVTAGKTGGADDKNPFWNY